MCFGHVFKQYKSSKCGSDFSNSGLNHCAQLKAIDLSFISLLSILEKVCLFVSFSFLILVEDEKNCTERNEVVQVNKVREEKNVSFHTCIVVLSPHFTNTSKKKKNCC